MSEDLHDRLPTADELREFDLRHVVAFATRCARRVQPIYHAMWLGAGVGYGFILERAIRASLQPWISLDAADDARADDSRAVAYAAACAAAAYAAAITADGYAAITADGYAAAAVYAAYAAAAAARVAAAAGYAAAAAVTADIDEAVRAAARTATAKVGLRPALIPLIHLIAADIETLHHQSTADRPHRLSAVHFGPLWGVTATDFAADAEITTRNRPSISRLLKNASTRSAVGFAARCAQRVHSLADLDDSADTTGVVYAIWQAESVAWDVRDANVVAERQSPFDVLPRGARNRISPQRRAVAGAVERAALAALQAANSVESQADCVERTLLAADEAIEAARLADEVDREEFGQPSTAHTDSLLAGMWDDLLQLADGGGGPARAFGPREHYRPLWAFNEVTDLPARIADLKKRFAPPPAPLILPRVPKVTEDEQRRIEALARQLLGGDHTVKVWFKLKSPDLGNKTPLSVLKTGNLGLLEFHIRSALRGDFG